MTARDVGVVIVAAGSSSRTGDGELKQFRWVAGRPMLLHTLQLFQSRADVAMVVCVLPREFAGDPPPWIFQSDTERMLVSVGGRTRAESVRNGIADLTPDCRIVLVHDAARPLVPPAVVDRVVAALRGGAQGVVPALPLADTVKRVGPDGSVAETLDRSALRAVQTPQGFPAGVLRDALAAHSADATDCASMVERLGVAVVCVEGDERAFKVTTPADLARAVQMAGEDDDDEGAHDHDHDG